ncbi:uncharacterized protein [Rutidosis leptorrhynchoides]|uniref:uncharacterized protein n=1 Tax=Rutidosis leptorrhynchoides TaxID=125765 RepID=UPI003A9931BE
MDKKMEDVDKRVEWLNSEQYSAAGDIFGEPQKTTRIGDEYQAKIPSLMTENERLQLIALPVYQNANTDVQNRFAFGLPIPVTWVTCKLEAMESAEGKSGILGSETGDDDLFPIPCSSGEESWTKIEHDSFVLGLYIFGKDLRVVNEFVGDKGLPNVVSYYYGRFYRSSEHQRWSMFSKKRKIKYLPGRKIFKGWRRQELLSRLLPNVTDECKTHLTQVSSAFDEGKISFEKFVFSLRDTVGINILVKAVAIGNEKQDLTTKTKKRIRSKKRHTTCSSLTTQEISDLLKDRIGLSKTRLNEVFWDAVWPRLLATGWHSEQTTNYALQNSKHSLVFLTPGVTKFSRRGLEKGSQYFDSFVDVLNKVAVEPQLLEHEPNQDTRLVQPHKKQDLGDEDEEHSMKCMIVDTSLDPIVNFAELSSLVGCGPMNMQRSCSVSGETDQDSKSESQNDDDLDVVVSKIEDKTMDLTNNVQQPIRKLKFVSKSKPKRIRVITSCEDEVKKDADSRIVIDLNSPRVAPFSGGGDSPKPSVLPETSTNEPEVSSNGNGQIIRQSTRNRPLTTKALEALANGFLNPPQKKKRGSEDRAPRRVRAKTALVSNCGAHYIENRVNGVS